MHTPFTSAAACAAICDVRDPTLRNLQITLSYHDIAQAVSARICTRNAPWVAFAAWASKQAGRFIRLESLPSHFGPLEPLLERFDDALDDVSAQISEGNFKVYRELAPLFARFLDVLDGPDPGARLDGFLAEPAPGPVGGRGPGPLAAGLHRLLGRAPDPDPGTRAQLILLANGQVGVHEQTRLQAQIAGSMLGALERLKARAGGLADSLGTPRFLRRIVAGFTWKFEEMWREVSTGLMGIALPEGTMTLGRDVPAARRPHVPRRARRARSAGAAGPRGGLGSHAEQHGRERGRGLVGPGGPHALHPGSVPVTAAGSGGARAAVLAVPGGDHPGGSHPARPPLTPTPRRRR
ncbi:MAG: hypothetical protein R3F43_08390 [bacterium]